MLVEKRMFFVNTTPEGSYVIGQSVSFEKINFIVEGGLNATFAKFDKNAIQINSLTIDLTTYYDPNLPNATAASSSPGVSVLTSKI